MLDYLDYIKGMDISVGPTVAVMKIKQKSKSCCLHALCHAKRRGIVVVSCAVRLTLRRFGIVPQPQADNGGKNELYRNWFDEYIHKNKGEDFDIIGLSYYPFWHGTLSDLANNMNDIAKSVSVCFVKS